MVKIAEQLVLLLWVGGKQAVVHGKDTTEECQIRQEPLLTFLKRVCAHRRQPAQLLYGEGTAVR